MNRTDFYKKTTVVDGQTNSGIDQFDYLYNSLSNFVMNYNPTYYQITEPDMLRLDMISFKNYGTVVYWWLIAYANEIHDPFADLYVGKLILIPNILDIYDFFKKWNVKK